MPQRDKEGKITFEMVSAGQAWNNFVDSKEGHNAEPVTPSYLSTHEQVPRPSIDALVEARRQQLENGIAPENNHANVNVSKQQEIEKDRAD